MTAWTELRVESSGSNSMLPLTFLKCPRTHVTIMWRARNSAAVCPGSKIHFVIIRLALPNLDAWLCRGAASFLQNQSPFRLGKPLDGITHGGPGDRGTVFEQISLQARRVGFAGLAQEPAAGFVDQVV